MRMKVCVIVALAAIHPVNVTLTDGAEGIAILGVIESATTILRSSAPADLPRHRQEAPYYKQTLQRVQANPME